MLAQLLADVGSGPMPTLIFLYHFDEIVHDFDPSFLLNTWNFELAVSFNNTQREMIGLS